MFFAVLKMYLKSLYSKVFEFEIKCQEVWKCLSCYIVAVFISLHLQDFHLDTPIYKEIIEKTEMLKKILPAPKTMTRLACEIFAFERVSAIRSFGSQKLSKAKAVPVKIDPRMNRKVLIQEIFASVMRLIFPSNSTFVGHCTCGSYSEPCSSSLF